MRIMAIDYGRARIGVAMSDPMRIIASPLCTIQNRGMRNSVAEIVSLVKKNSVTTIVVGLPIHMDGGESELSTESREFGNLLQQEIKVTVDYFDERFTSKMAERALDERSSNNRSPKNTKKNNELVDSVAASMLLQHYLDVKPRQ